jgi:hypothetical protein
MTCNAFSPETQVRTQEKPSSELISLVQLSRTSGLSSTKITFTGGFMDWGDNMVDFD